MLTRYPLAGATGVLTGYMGGANGALFTGAASPYTSAASDPVVTKYAEVFLSQIDRAWPASANIGMAWRP